ncbi:PREDICTED: uncharacterized protein LOC104352875 [Leptosomus discolor]|uniref:uncharacterized protein LOC104352875 n=1 Tax=Leptosomus discolor TaxID=188344 RepID=UPI0005224D6E|nr:PREDICTED: uncharacterized protein LOC104352875 [Leptosomus discolor]
MIAPLRQALGPDGPALVKAPFPSAEIEMQKLKELGKRDLEKLLEEAWRVFRNREEVDREKLSKTIAVATVAALGQRGGPGEGSFGNRGRGIGRRSRGGFRVTPEFEEIINQVYPGVWASGIPGKAKNATPIVIELKEGLTSVRKKQYPLRLEDCKGIESPINNFIQHRLLVECELEYFTLFYHLRNLMELWIKEAQNAFSILKKELMRAPALGLPDITKPFWLFSHEKQGVALGVLARRLGPHKRAVAYFSKQLDEVSKGWPACLRAVAAVILNIEEARKFTLGQKMTVMVSHTVSAVLEQKGNHWLSPSRFLKYQAILVESDDVAILGESDDVVIEVTNFVNLASFLSDMTTEPLIHDCLETIEAVCSSTPDLKEEPMEDAQDFWFTDGSSFIRRGTCKAGYAITAIDKVIESAPLPIGTSAQKAEIIALTRALELAEGKKINVWTDSKYAFGVVCAHAATWKERGLLTSQGKHIKHAEEILRLLKAVPLPTKVAIMHCQGHMKGNTDPERGNRLADIEAKQAAERDLGDQVLVLIPTNRNTELSEQEDVKYSKIDQELISELWEKNQLKPTLKFWTRAEEQLSLRKNKGLPAVTKRSHQPSSPRPPDDYHKEALRKRRWEKFMGMTSWD